MSTPRRASASGTSTPSYTTPVSRRQSTPAESRRALGSGTRDRGTPVGRLLASEGVVPRSPRRVRKTGVLERVQDWPQNVLLSLETTLAEYLSSMDGLGYPLALALHALHLLTRLSVFAAALPSFTGLATRATSSARALALADADARLEALKRLSRAGARSNWTWTWGTSISLLLVLVSLGNALYLFTRRRSYQLVLQTDPLASPSARTTTLDFSTSPPKLSAKRRLQRWAWSFISSANDDDERPKEYRIQQLDVWTPEYVVYSLRLFSLYPPPIALMYHFLTPSNFIVLVVSGALVIAQTYVLVSFYTTLLADRQTLSREVMREYNVRFVNPRLSVQKRDVGVMTNEAEFITATDLEPRGSARRTPARTRRV